MVGLFVVFCSEYTWILLGPTGVKVTTTALKQSQAPGFEAAPAPLEGSAEHPLSLMCKKGILIEHKER